MRNFIDIVESAFSSNKDLNEGIFSSDPLKKVLSGMKSYDPKRIEIKKLRDSHFLLSLHAVEKGLGFKAFISGLNDKVTELFTVVIPTDQLKNIGSSVANRNMKYNDQELIFRGIKSRIENLKQVARDIETSEDALKERNWLKDSFNQ